MLALALMWLGGFFLGLPESILGVVKILAWGAGLLGPITAALVLTDLYGPDYGRGRAILSHFFRGLVANVVIGAVIFLGPWVLFIILIQASGGWHWF